MRDADLAFAAPPRIDDDLAARLLDLWVRVNDAGGAVGFLPGDPRDLVAAALDAHRAAVDDGSAVLGVLGDPDGDSVAGFAFWQRPAWWGHGHQVVLKRFMVDPDLRGRGLGRRLMDGMVDLAATLPDVELLTLGYRSGLGIGHIYAALGWVETGRAPLALRFHDGTRRDDVTMMRRVDGTPLEFDGRL